MSLDVFTTPRTRFGNFPSQEIKATPLQTPQNPVKTLELEVSTISFDECPTDAISNLPTEIGLQIFSLLDPVTAMCLGLTNRKMYSFYLSHHDRKVVLNQFVVVDGEVIPLHRLMKDWGVRGWVYDGYCPGRFVRGTETIIHERGRKKEKNTKQPTGTLQSVFGYISGVVGILIFGWGREWT